VKVAFSFWTISKPQSGQVVSLVVIVNLFRALVRCAESLGYIKLSRFLAHDCAFFIFRREVARNGP
jgi:hypothetical protein